MTKKTSLNNSQKITAELLFLKYKGILAPWEIIAQAKRVGFKCKKYANWSDVHVSEDSRVHLKKIGDSLIDSGEFDLSAFGELSKVWERVQRWSKDKDGFSIEPDIRPEFEKIQRILDIGSTKPDVIDLIIYEFGYEINAISIDDRWTLFLAICIHNFFQSSKRYQCIVKNEVNVEFKELEWRKFICSVVATVVELYLQVGFEISTNDDKAVISLFVKETGCTELPSVTERSASGGIKNIPRVWIESYEGSQSELVRFQHSDGSVIVKLNKDNKIFHSNKTVGKLLVDEEFWTLIGNTLHSHLGQLDEIQEFFDTFAKQLRLRN